MISLARQHDVLVLDLDGTVYLGGEPIDHVSAALAEAARQGSHAVFVTNNASRPPDEVAAALISMGVPAEADDVLTSPQVAARMLADTHAPGSAVLVVGAPWLARSVADVGLEPVRQAEGDPSPVAVVQGHSPDTGWRDLAEACIVLRTGSDWVACNVDSTLPTDRGLLPGNGAMVQALMAATGLTPRVAGKPERPLLDEAVQRTGSTSPLIVGDRLDTDIEFAHAAATPSLLVLTGVSTAADLLAAPVAQRPDYVAYDLRGLVDPDLAVAIPNGEATDSAKSGQPGQPGNGLWTVTVEDHALRLTSQVRLETDTGRDDPKTERSPSDVSPLRALALLAAAAWASGLTAVVASDDAAAAALRRSGLAIE